MENYNLTPDMVKEHLVDIQYKSKKDDKDPFVDVPTQTKSALTRTYNQKHKDSLKRKAKSKTKAAGSHYSPSTSSHYIDELNEDLPPLEDPDRSPERGPEEEEKQDDEVIKTSL